ncbi:phage baseplate protein [Vibrio crassostreae]|uniref:phage baseplate protein n=3 Tax=Vibrio crassostreae TaxID=246167 RepID=UPI000631406A|nr:hypothetical protein [Vibrio crassostreae]CAK2896823.1 conserved hypothetical protein [Vibrio crassostreae]CAK2957557.1 conserved hypothetical protein [Vibrio crassostreae]CDT58193.1 hypothetical protein VCRLGP107_760079 [Vibrio crassostreae]
MVDETRISELDPASSEDGIIQTIVIQESSDGQGLDNFRAELYSVETIDRLEQESLERDSQLDQRINQTNTDLLLEAEARWQADVLLALAIEDEANERIQADELLQENIDTETQARIDADTALDLRIDGVIDDVGDVSQALAQEVQDRIDGDVALGERIDTETQQRQQDVSDVNERIDHMYSNDMVNTFDDQSINGTKSFEKIQSQTDEVISDKQGNSVLLSTDEHNTFGQDYKHVRLRGVSVPKWVHADGEVDNLATEQQVLDETQARIEADNALASDISDNADSISQNASDISNLQTGKEDSIPYGPSGYMALVNEDGDGFEFVTPPDFSFFRLRGIMTEYSGPDDSIIAVVGGDGLNEFLYRDIPPNVAEEIVNGFAYRSQENFSVEITDGGGIVDITIGDFLFWNTGSDQWLHLPTSSVEGGVESINNLAGVINFAAGTGLDIVVNAVNNTITFLIDESVATETDIQALQAQITENAEQIVSLLEDMVFVTEKLVELENSIGDNAFAITALTLRVAQNESSIQTLFEDFSTHIDDTENPHQVTAAQVGAATTGALAAHVGDTDNPHEVTPGQIGAATSGALTAHTGDTDNPHEVTASQVGAAPASHVSDTDNPHSVTAEQVGAVSEEALQEHLDDVENPHAVTAAQAGAAPASHVTDQTNPHAVTAAQVGAATTGALAAHIGDTENPHEVTPGQIGAAPASHTTDETNPHAVTAAQVGAAQVGGSGTQTFSVATPTESSHATDRGYVDNRINELLEPFKVGSCYFSMTGNNPAIDLGYGVWELITGNATLSFGDGEVRDGAVIGANTHTLTAAEMPSHTHTGPSHTHSTPNHTHTASSNSTGAHSHGVLSSTGGGSGAYADQTTGSGANYAIPTDSDGAHAHTITVNSGGASTTGAGGTGATGGAGGGEAHNVQSARILINVWQRTE